MVAARRGSSIVRVWLEFLTIPAYTDTFLEHGYADMETIKQMTEEDLLEVGVLDEHHRHNLIIS